MFSSNLDPSYESIGRRKPQRKPSKEAKFPVILAYSIFIDIDFHHEKRT